VVERKGLPLKNLIKPPQLTPGDTIATVSPAWGCAGDSDFRWRYDLGVKRLKEEFGLIAKPMPYSLRGANYLSKNPQARAEDLMTAFSNPSVKAIIANIGGNDSIRLLPYIDEKIIRDNPKIFIGCSDIMSVHLMCHKAGLASFYGANLMPSFGDAQGVHPYTKYWFEKTLFHNEPIVKIAAPDEYTADPIVYTDPTQQRQYHPSKLECLQGKGKVNGRLFGGHMGFSEMPEELLAPLYEPDLILFLEDIVDCVKPDDIYEFFKWIHKKGVTKNINGIIFGRFNEYPENKSYRQAAISAMREVGLEKLPVLWNMPFGHTSPICVIPYGALAEIDCDNTGFSILESGVV
jgi:muramoyltetrapeptide carboxypeptidase LdcA involved in peptidoglycan recycling